jgi:hypothetical protein
VKDLYNANYKTLKEGIKEDTRRWNGLQCHGLAELIL